MRSETRDAKKEYVHADVEGPGAVVRIWSANPSGILHFCIDGEKFPSTFGTGTEDYFGSALSDENARV